MFHFFGQPFLASLLGSFAAKWSASLVDSILPPKKTPGYIPTLLVEGSKDERNIKARAYLNRETFHFKLTHFPIVAFFYLCFLNRNIVTFRCCCDGVLTGGTSASGEMSKNQKIYINQFTFLTKIFLC